MNESVLLSSPTDPVGEAREFAERQRYDVDAFVVVGLGDGYHVSQIARRIGSKPAIWIDADPEIAGRLSLPEGARTHFGVNPGLLSAELKRLLDESGAETVSCIVWPPSLRTNPFHATVIDETKIAINRRVVEVMTLVAHSNRLDENAIANLPHFHRAHGVNDFNGYRNHPAIVVASGPSLDDNAIGFLREIRPAAVIVAAAKSCSLLRKNGVDPHFVVALDMSPESKSCFVDVAGIPLVFDMDCFSEIVAEHRGRIVTGTTGTAISDWAQLFCPQKGELRKGLSVAHTAFNFAIACGCSPVILVGVDLAFPGSRTHADGSTKTWGGAVADLPAVDIIDVPCVAGGSVKSLRSFQSFVTAFEDEIARTKATVINTSPAGALIRGAFHRPELNMIAADLRGLLSLPEIRLSVADAVDADRFRFAIGSLIRDLYGLFADCDMGLVSIKNADKCNDDEKSYVVRAIRTHKKIDGSSAFAICRRMMIQVALDFRKQNALLQSAMDSGNRVEAQRLNREMLRKYFSEARTAIRFCIERLERVKG